MFRATVCWGLPMLALLAACAGYRALAPAPATTLGAVPPERQQPALIAPRHDLPLVATDAQLAAVLARVRPRTGEADTNYLIHALRLWGAEAYFADETHLAGRAMLAYLLDDRQFAELAGSQSPPLLTVSNRGVRVRKAIPGDPFATTGSVHSDDLLATLGEVGVPLDMPLYGRSGETSVRALLEDSLARYHTRQQEYEWTAIAYARYALADRPWTNRTGETIDLDALVADLMEQPLRQGGCGGAHRLEALAVLLAADEQVHALSRRTRKTIREHLQKVVARLVATQDPQGFWTKAWDGDAHRFRQAAAGAVPLADRILSTGHQLEWMALLPADLLPPRDVIVRAGQWLAHAMLEVDDATLRVEYGPFTHAARALCLWRGAEPWAIWQRVTVDQAAKHDI